MAKNSFSVIFILIGAILLGNIGFNYIVNLMVGSVQLQPVNLIGSLLLLGVTFTLSLRIIYQLDRQGGRLKRRIKWFEPVEDNYDE
ncbi:MAG: hypothetical protein M1503_01615 [Thaumarchaeota archaeon]|nr:hypothetical protein [Nitrososphaerota archaeon]MCL5316954.1 hypothetical protein [Nitrososphaerota archaeon]